jgi:predicted RNase H-like HicB family nuclease
MNWNGLKLKRTGRSPQPNTIERQAQGESIMKLKVIIHEAEEGGFWAEVPAIPGCATQGDSFEELLENLYESIEGCLSVDVEPLDTDSKSRIMEIAI